jgi:tRNA (adenine57-N1/adenine58-N1)-methyltransferase|tara:strand:- start:984 stop:1718 length:735 start_codon:yes stop_codon:yes gene_type:complete
MVFKKTDQVQLIGHKNYLIYLDQNSFSTEYGNFDLKAIRKMKPGDKVKTHMGKEFTIVVPRIPDKLRKIKRAPQIITFKDAGIIAAHTGMCKEDVVVEAGGGSGAMTIFMASIVKQVHTYEIRKDFHAIVKKNLERCGVTNVDLKHADVTKGIKEKNVDIVMLDMGAPASAVPGACKALKPGGFIVGYCPTVEQVVKFKNSLTKFSNIIVREIIERIWEAGGDMSRPKTAPIGHTAFLIFARKI